jgi:uncharacterized membrane protein
MNGNQKTVNCRICKETKKLNEVIAIGTLRDVIKDVIKKDHPDLSDDGYICQKDLQHYRMDYIQNILAAEKGEISLLEAEVLKSIKDEEILAKNINSEYEDKLTFGQRLADRVAEFGGSWNFIISFSIVLTLWVTINTLSILIKPFDPFPFILLNLFLSGIAALQAPIIMMSQNRQESKDRMRAEHDYQVNLKAELEIRTLGEKMDHILHTQWQRLIEIQQIQTDLMEEIESRTTPKK